MDFPASEVIGYLEGRPVLPVVRRIVNILLSLSLSSFVFQLVYFKYQWIDLSDYKADLDFFIKGYFFLPFAVFILIHYVFAFVSWAIFTSITTRKSGRVLVEINHPGLNSSDYRKMIGLINKFSIIWGKKFSEAQMYVWIHQEFGNMPQDQWQSILTDIARFKPIVRANFQLALKALVTISLYFFSIPYFGILSYLSALSLLLTAIWVLCYIDLLLETFPQMVQSAKENAAAFLNHGAPPTTALII